MNSNESALEEITNQLNAYLGQKVEHGYLADILSIWDSDDHCWVDAAPVVLRFEWRDFTIWWPDGSAAALDTKPIRDLDGCDTKTYLADDVLWDKLSHHLEWRTCGNLIPFVGKKATRSMPGTFNQADSLWLDLEGNAALQFAPDGTTCFMPTEKTI